MLPCNCHRSRAKCCHPNVATKAAPNVATQILPPKPRQMLPPKMFATQCCHRSRAKCATQMLPPSCHPYCNASGTCIALNHFLRDRIPDGKWTFLAVILNPRIRLHRDMGNMIGMPNYAIALGCFEEGGSVGRRHEGTSPDKLVMKNKFIRFEARGSTSVLQHPSISQGRAAQRAYGAIAAHALLLSAAPMTTVKNWDFLCLNKPQKCQAALRRYLRTNVATARRVATFGWQHLGGNL